MRDNTIEAFFALVRAGLWETEVQLASNGEVDYADILRLAQEQAVVGLVAAGLEHVTDVKVPQAWALQFAGQTIQLEQRNKAMNQFIADLVSKMRDADIYTLLVKGQGVAQCYERPLWRSCGDIDFFLSNENYVKARSYFDTTYIKNEEELLNEQHLSYTAAGWEVELHGTMRTTLLKRVDQQIDALKQGIFNQGRVRVWRNNKTDIFLPEQNDDVILVFTHFLKHFYNGGIGLRQVCDWCRLLWTYRNKINIVLLEERVRKMGVRSEWRSFASLAVYYLGMPIDSMPLYSPSKKWKRKASSILNIILKTGNFGHKKDNTYYTKYSFFVRKTISLNEHIRDFLRQVMIFPINSIHVFVRLFFCGINEALIERKNEK